MPKSPPARKRAAPLEKYRGKRNFKATPEPAAKRKKTADGHMFVVQEHHARSHHFDFRLEMDGVLVSWAVPKGIPEDTGSNRLAVHVEDHPVEYGSFEGEIPKGNYGAGKVAIWDQGNWEPLEGAWKRDFAKGKFKFILHGKRLDGPYLLARMKEEPNWLLRKLDPATHPTGTIPEPETEPPSFVAPQLTKSVATVPQGKDWLHEVKYDGYRLIAVRREGKVRLFTRKQLDWTDRFASLAKKLEKLRGGDFVLDGEAVVFDAKGRTSFSGLQAALKGAGDKISFVAFDVLNAEGKNLRDLPLSARLGHLKKLVPEEDGPIRRSKTWQGEEGADLFRQACKLGLEGIISKHTHARYVPESRRDWVKSKCRPRQEFVICGYTAPKNSCPAFGALVLGSFENGKLVPRGKVGTGFSEDARRSLLKQMEKRAVTAAPFEAERGVNWIRPELVAEIEFAELTHEGSIRQGSFISLREDKTAREVHLDAVEQASIGEEESTVQGIVITHPERMVFPGDGIQKLEVARYHERIAELMLPHIVDRPLALLRAPDGIGGGTFFQKSFKDHIPPKVKMKTLDDGTEVIHIGSEEGLISLIQFGVLEIHPWGSSFANIDKPDVLVWDFDPHESVPWPETLGAAFLLRDYLAKHDLESRVKTSGGKGLHVMLHLKRMHDWETMKAFAKAVAARIAELSPRRFTIVASKAKRGGKIYIDWLRNGKGATCIAPWGLRARPGAPVSTPLDWKDLADLDPRGFTMSEPFKLPADWANITPQTVSKALIKEVSEG
jgi:bifunctional non-homologous end joining protein LigD